MSHILVRLSVPALKFANGALCRNVDWACDYSFIWETGDWQSPKPLSVAETATE